MRSLASTVLGCGPVEGRPQKHLALILARGLASQLATATFIADANGIENPFHLRRGSALSLPRLEG